MSSALRTITRFARLWQFASQPYGDKLLVTYQQGASAPVQAMLQQGAAAHLLRVQQGFFLYGLGLEDQRQLQGAPALRVGAFLPQALPDSFVGRFSQVEVQV